MNICISCLGVKLDKQGGLQIRIKELVKGLARNDHQVTILQTRETWNGSRVFADSMRDHGVDIVQMPISVKTTSSAVGLMKIALHPVAERIGEDIDLIDTYDPYMVLPSRTPPLVYSSNYYLEYLYHHRRNVSPSYLGMPALDCLLRQVILRRADVLIVENSVHRDWLVKFNGIENERIRIVPPGYDETLVRLKMATRTQHLPDRVMMYSGRLTKEKGLLDLLSAYKALRMEFPKWHLWIVGGGPLLEEAREFVASSGMETNVEFFGELSYTETIGKLTCADVFVLPSRIESIPLTIIEAMACGKPVVATRVGGIERDLIDTPSKGLLVDPGNLDSLTQALRAVMSRIDQWEGIACESRETALDLTFDAMVKRTLNAYYSAIGRHRARRGG